ncbi:MAG: DegV family protein [Clostridia bacterium]|nr:DegV family protein [Clostridia bacterium]
MTELKLFTDSTSDLTHEECREMGIGMIPLSINFNDKSYLDKVNITSEKLLEIMSSTGEIAQSASPSPVAFCEAFATYVEKNITVLCICLASSLSSTYSNAVIASQNFPEGAVTVIDSNTVAGLLGALVRACYVMQKNDEPVEKIIEEARYLADHQRLYFTVESLTQLHKNGRLSSASYVAGSLLGIKPIIEMTKEGLKVKTKVRGNAKAINEMINLVKADKDRIRYNILNVASVGSTRQHLDSLRKSLNEATGINEFYEYEIGCTLVCHTGNNAYGFGYFVNE